MFDLLHVAEDVLPTVEHSSTLLRVQLVDEIGGEVLIGVLIPETHVTMETGQSQTEPAGDCGMSSERHRGHGRDV